MRTRKNKVMKGLLVTQSAVSNSITKLQLDDILLSNRIAFPTSTQPQRTPINKRTPVNRSIPINKRLVETLDIKDFDEMSGEKMSVDPEERALSSEEASIFQNTRPESRKTNSAATPATISAPDVESISQLIPRRTRGKANNSVTDFAEVLRSAMAISAKARIEKHKMREETARLRIKCSAEMDGRRLQLEWARFKTESRLADRAQKIGFWLRQEELEIERAKAKLPPLRNRPKLNIDLIFKDDLEDDLPSDWYQSSTSQAIARLT